MKEEQKRLLWSKAIEARKLSYSPYSKFAVGSALLCKNGKIYQGANIENSSYPLSMCGERNAIYHALMEGEKPEDFEVLAIVADVEGVCSPCGACRQVINELFPKGKPILLCNLKGEMKETTIDELLPFSFGKEALPL